MSVLNIDYCDMWQTDNIFNDEEERTKDEEVSASNLGIVARLVCVFFNAIRDENLLHDTSMKKFHN